MKFQNPKSKLQGEPEVRFEELAAPERTFEERLAATDLWAISNEETAGLMQELIARDRARDPWSWGAGAEAQRAERMRLRAAGDYLSGRNRGES